MAAAPAADEGVEVEPVEDAADGVLDSSSRNCRPAAGTDGKTMAPVSVPARQCADVVEVPRRLMPQSISRRNFCRKTALARAAGDPEEQRRSMQHHLALRRS
jgi:hypothetical protein